MSAPEPSATLARMTAARSRWQAFVGLDGGPRGPGTALGPGLARWASEDAPRELPVPDVRQQTTYTCGPACLLCACGFFGVPATEEELADLCGTTEAGTPPDALAQAAQQKGLTAEVHEGLTLDDLSQLLADGAVVVLALQAWSPDGPGHDYGAEWDDGHYVVPTAVTPDRIVFEDPSVADKRVTLTPDELEERWHDVAQGERQDHLGVVLRGPRGFEPAPAPVPESQMEPMG